MSSLLNLLQLGPLHRVFALRLVIRPSIRVAEHAHHVVDQLAGTAKKPFIV